MLLAAIGQSLYYRFEHWRKQKAIELHYPELVAKKDVTEWNLVRLYVCMCGIKCAVYCHAVVNHVFKYFSDHIPELVFRFLAPVLQVWPC